MNDSWFSTWNDSQRVVHLKNLVDDLTKNEERLQQLVVNLSRDVARISAVDETQNKNMDLFFLVMNGIVVILLQAGFAFLECGSVRSKNVTNILIKNILDTLLGALAFFLFGFAFTFGHEGYTNAFIGYYHFAGQYITSHGHWAEWFWQFVLATTASTIVSGAVAERCAFAAYFVYSLAITGFIYPVVAHWGWTKDGFLYAAGYRDFAGSGLVHLTGGVAAFVGTWMMGPRIGRFDYGLFDVNKANALKGGKLEGHSVPLTALGGLLLLVGFFSFNGGAQMTIHKEGDGEEVSLAVANTIIAASAAGVVALVINRISLRGQPTGKWSILMTINASIAGMVSICCSCNKVDTWAALVIGAVAAPVMMGISKLIQKMRIDDPLNAVAVHAGGGIWGLIAMPFFLLDTGLFYGNPDVIEGEVRADHMLGMSVAGILVIVLWTGGLTGLMFGGLRFAGLLRVDQQTEVMGMDLVKHGEPAYPAAAYGGDMIAVSERLNKGKVLVGNSVPIIAPNPNIFNGVRAAIRKGEIGGGKGFGNDVHNVGEKDNDAYEEVK